MSNDSLQHAAERDALVKVRAHLDQQEADRPISSVREASVYLAKALPLVVGGVVLLGLITAAGVFTYRKAFAPKPPSNRAEYAAAVFTRVELHANKHHLRQFDGLVGRVDVSFVVKPNGRVEAMTVLGPPRDRVAEQAALLLVKAAEPFGRFPEGTTAEPLSLRGTWRFQGPGERAAFAPTSDGR